MTLGDDFAAKEPPSPDIAMHSKPPMSPITQRRLRNFAANRRGFWALWLFLALFGVSLVSEFIASDRPIIASYRGELLFPFAVNYPEAKFGGFLATTNFRDLQAQLEGTENRISVERGRFNDTVQAYNTAVRRFPAVLLAGIFGFAQRPYFTAAPGEETAPKVDFGGKF